MKRLSNLLIVVGVVFIAIFGYQYFKQERAQGQSMSKAQERLEKTKEDKFSKEEIARFKVGQDEAFAILDIPKLGKSLPIVEGTDPEALDKGVGHLTNSVYPGQGEQILLSGHRDTVFRSFGKIEIGDHFIVNMPYGSYTYEIKETKIVPEDDTTVIGEMGEEVLVVTTCYPFSYIGNAPDRFVAYAYPVDVD